MRHGQASFGADDYDVLSPRGHEQAVRLGEYWRGRGMAFDAVMTGTLRRHTETFAGHCPRPADDARSDPLAWPE